MGTGERVHERRLAGAVAADEGDHLAGVQVDGDAVDGVDAAEGDADVAHLHERDGPRCDGDVVSAASVMAAPPLRPGRSG